MKKAKHHIKKVSNIIYEKGDPDFVDERKKLNHKKRRIIF